MKINNKTYTKEELREYIGNIAQLGGTRHYQLEEGKSKGLRAIDFKTGTGFNFTVVPDRGMDISSASYKGNNIVYLTSNGESSPSFFEAKGTEWLRTFFGGLLTTCGLTYFGNACVDEGEELGVHGRYNHIPAKKVNDKSGWEKDEYILELSGIIEESKLFGNKLRMKRKISSKIGSKAVEIDDEVENFGYQKSPFTILYHINIGFPLLNQDSKFYVSAKKTEPANKYAKEAGNKTNGFSSPVVKYNDLNFHHIIKGDCDNYGYSLIVNSKTQKELGLYVKFKLDNLPFLNQWKKLAKGEYVLGMEPCNTKCKSRDVLRKKGILPFLEPGEKKEMNLEIGILEGKEEVIELINKIKNL